jgi:hypothetical protein
LAVGSGSGLVPDLGPDGQRQARVISNASSSYCYRMEWEGCRASPASRGRLGWWFQAWRCWPSSPSKLVGRLAAVLSHSVPVASWEDKAPSESRALILVTAGDGDVLGIVPLLKVAFVSKPAKGSAGLQSRDGWEQP